MSGMAGRLLGDKEILKYIQLGIIRIEPFRPELLKWAWYALHPYAIWNDIQTKNIEEDIELVHLDKSGYIVEPQDFVVVEIKERIVLADGIVGQFIPASNAIEKGGVLTVGKLDPGYTSSIRFGFMNAKRHPIDLYPVTPLVYIQFFDIRETSLPRGAKSEYEEHIERIRDTESAADLLEQLAQTIRKRPLQEK